MKLLYLTEDYLYSKVHNNMLNALLEQDPSLIIYVFAPARNGQDRSRSLESSFKHHERLIEVIPQVDIPIPLYKIDFWAKLRCKVRLIEKNIPIREIDAIHAATLYAEGGAARKLQKKYGIPYFASIRGGDVMFYARKMPHLWMTGIKIMKDANALACVTPSIKTRMMERWQHAGIREVLENADVVNNGIDNIWLEQLRVSPKVLGIPIRVLYIGRFDINKNVLRLIEAVSHLRLKYNIKLTLIGGSGEEHESVIKAVNDNPDYLEYLGAIYDKEELIKVVRECDVFAMVSHSETFGLVYAECLSQGLPILYTRGTGFDGMYEDGYVGYSADSYSTDSIKEGLGKIIDNYEELRKNISQIDFSRYSWKKTTNKYLNYYESIKPQKDNMGGANLRKVAKDIYYCFKHLTRKPYDVLRKNKINRTNRIASRAIVKYSRLGNYNYIAGGTSLFNVTMGSYCSIGPGCLLGGMEHDYNWYSTSARLHETKSGVPETIIGNDVWIGAECIIRAGVRIGDGAVIGANSLVTKDVEPYSITYGSPARHVRYRFEQNVRDAIQKSEFWKMSPDVARKKLFGLNLIKNREL